MKINNEEFLLMSLIRQSGRYLVNSEDCGSYDRVIENIILTESRNEEIGLECIERCYREWSDSKIRWERNFNKEN